MRKKDEKKEAFSVWLGPDEARRVRTLMARGGYRKKSAFLRDAVVGGNALALVELNDLLGQIGMLCNNLNAAGLAGKNAEVRNLVSECAEMLVDARARIFDL